MERKNNEIKKKLVELADLKYKEFHSKLCPGTHNILGVRVPILRNYAKELTRTDWRIYLKEIENEYYEEIMLQGMILGIANMECEERLDYIKKFVPKIDNWAVCDVVCAGLKFVKKNTETVWTFLQSYLNSNKEFELRFGIVMLLDYYITPDYIDKVLVCLEGIKNEGYYVKMAVALTLSVAYVKYPDKTMKYLKVSTLDNFAFNKAIQKIMESYRVSEEQKSVIKKMNRK